MTETCCPNIGQLLEHRRTCYTMTAPHRVYINLAYDDDDDDEDVVVDL